jgi:hypothetical protein
VSGLAFRTCAQRDRYATVVFSRRLSVLNASAKVKFVGHEVCRPAREAIHHLAGVSCPLMGSLAWESQPLAGSSRPVQQSNVMKQIRLGLPGQRYRRPRPKAKNAAISPSPRSPHAAAPRQTVAVRGRYGFWVAAAEDHVMTEPCDHGDPALAAAAASELSPRQPATARPAGRVQIHGGDPGPAGKLDREEGGSRGSRRQRQGHDARPASGIPYPCGPGDH